MWLGTRAGRRTGPGGFLPFSPGSVFFTSRWRRVSLCLDALHHVDQLLAVKQLNLIWMIRR
jgi:hypothetical protein